MSAVKMGSGSEAEEELRAIGTWASIGHRKDTTTSVLIDEVFIIEICSVDGFAASAVVCSKITTLGHEALDDSVETASLEAVTLLHSAELFEVFGGSGSVRGESHGNPTSCLTTNGDVEEDCSVSCTCHIFYFLSF